MRDIEEQKPVTVPVAHSPIQQQSYQSGPYSDTDAPNLGTVPYTTTSSSFNYPVVYSYPPPPPSHPSYVLVQAPSPTMYSHQNTLSQVMSLGESHSRVDGYQWSVPVHIPSQNLMYTTVPVSRMLEYYPGNVAPSVGVQDINFVDSDDVRQVFGRVYALSRDQAGCRLLQRLICSCSEHCVELMYNEIQHVLPHIMTHCFGNYFIQCLFNRASPALRFHIINSISGSFDVLCSSMYGSRSVQAMVIQLSSNTELTRLFVRNISPFVDSMCTNKYGNHVIQRCLEYFNVHSKGQIIHSLLSCYRTLCLDQYGNTVIQIAISTMPETSYLSEVIANEALSMMQDTYGNYVIQTLLEHCPTLSQIVCCKCIDCFVQLSKQKCSSVVMERCFTVAPLTIKAQYVNEICAPGNIMGLVTDKYGNFVLQTALTNVPDSMKNQLINALRPCSHLLDRCGWGKKIITQLEHSS